MCRSHFAVALLVAAACAGSAADGQLSDEAASAYRQDGWVLTRGALDPAEVRQIADVLPGLLREQGRRAFADEGGVKEVRFSFAVHELSEVVADFVARPGNSLWSAAAELANTTSLCLLMARGFSKDPGDKDTHWHRDDEAIGLPQAHPELRTVHAWIPLSPMGRDMGTLKYMLGTHSSPTHVQSLIASMWGWEVAWYLTSRETQDDAFQLGDVAWHDGSILHSAGANAGDGVRDGLVVSLAYCGGPSGCAGGARRKSESDATCRVADHLFDEAWLARHRSGEEDYVKTYLAEPFYVRAGRFTWRTVVGACLGLAFYHCLPTGAPASKEKEG